MKILLSYLLVSVAFLPTVGAQDASAAHSITSPNGETTVTFSLNDKGAPRYKVQYAGQPLLLNSALGLDLKGDANLTESFTIASSSTRSHDDTWKPFVGERSEIRDHYNELVVDLSKNDKPALQIKFRAYNEGIAFCYALPEEAGRFTITGELSQFHFAGDHFCWDTKDPQAV